MKIKYLLSTAIVSAIALTSCSFLDEFDPNSVTTGNFYISESDIDTSVNGVYAALKQSYYYQNNHFFTDERAHVTVERDAGANSGIPYQFYNYTLTAENTYVYNRYSQLYKLIARANTVLAHIDDVTYAKADTRDSYEAQVLFLRALTYYHLVVEWGDVPLVLSECASRDEVNAANHRVPKRQVYQAIFDDLKVVTESPLPNHAAECGRANKAAAYALWGKALLQAGSDEDFADENRTLLTEAVEKLSKAWEMRTFGELSEIAYSSLWNLSTQKNNPESLFQINYIQGNADLGSAWNYLYGPIAGGTTSLHQGQLYNATTAEIYGMFDVADLRREYLRPVEQAGITYYHTMKYVDLDCGADGYGGNNWFVLRYADVVLMLAEANLKLGNDTTAVAWMNMVRKRAGLPDWSGSDLRQGIYDERLFEFMQEGHRWHDLRRMYPKAEMISVFNAINSNFGLKDLLLPIPYNERVLNPEGLYQNPGYPQD